EPPTSWSVARRSIQIELRALRGEGGIRTPEGLNSPTGLANHMAAFRAAMAAGARLSTSAHITVHRAPLSPASITRTPSNRSRPRGRRHETGAARNGHPPALH